MATVLRTTHGIILLAIQARLMADLGFPVERVLIATRDRTPIHPQADQYLILRPLGLRPLKPIIHGAGRLDFRVVLTLAITLVNRLARDESTQDAYWLTDASAGQTLLEAAVINSLAVVPLETLDGNWLLYEPPEFDFGDVPAKDKREPEWGQSTLNFKLPFVMALDQPAGGGQVATGQSFFQGPAGPQGPPGPTGPPGPGGLTGTFP